MRFTNTNALWRNERISAVSMVVTLLLLLCSFRVAYAGDKAQMAPMAPPPGPTVWLTITPNSSPSYVAPASVNVSVEAYDNSGYDITQIKLYKNNVLVTTAPGGFLDATLNSLAAGSYTIRATATSESGGTGSKSQTFTVSVPTNQAPTVSLAADGANYVAPATINLTATAADSDGTVSKVEFYNGGTLIGTDTSAPYTMSWTGVGGGSYNLTARATDNASAVTTSSAVSVTVNSSVITGNIDGVVNSSTIRGWACSTYRNDSIAVHLYLGGAYGTGTAIGAYNANLASEAGIATTCSASGTNYRFEIPLTDAIREQYAGQAIYVHGISPVGGANSLISQSGAFTVPPPPRASAFVSQSVPSTMVIGQSYAVSVQMKNTGTATWSEAEAYRLGAQNPHDNGTWGGRLYLTGSVATGQTATFNATVTAPTTPGTYNFQWGMVQDGVAWFGPSTPNVAVTVTPPPPPPPPATASSKTEVIEYHDDLSKWVLGQQKKLTVNNIVVSETTFNANAQPETVKSFGKPQQTLTYNADGTIATVKDGNNNVTTLSNWYRGVPKNIQYADGTTESATVNDNGWITSVTDENGYVTGYGYDAMGRLASIVYPIDDNVPWNTTTKVFEPVATAMLGLPAGHWRQSISTGNARQYIYYDALWRPVLEESYDATDYANTLSQVVKRYDSEGRLVFQSYPTRGVADFNQSLPGTWTEYDALGRVTSVSQDSEQGLLVTLTEYLPGFQTRTTNPRSNSTTTSYQTFDQPSYDSPVTITHPEGAYTEIYRDVFGKPTSIVRRNGGNSQRVERRYVYNGNQELCRAVEPEVGNTFMGYDAVGNLAWSAVGYPDTTVPDCSDPSWVAARRVDRTYDARNRLKTLVFPDGKGNQSWTYTPDGQPASITTYNDSNNGLPVVNSYTYNKRRLLINEASEQPGWYTWNLGYGYTTNGHLASQSYPTGLVVTYGPNALGQSTQVADTGGQTYASGISYYPNGAIKQFTYGNGIVHTMTQNVRQLPTRSTDCIVAGCTAAADKRLDLTYAFDKNANVSQITDNIDGRQTRGMSYDGLDRLTQTTSNMFGTASYSYDVLDNLTQVNVAGGSQARNHYYCYDANGRLGNVKTGSCTGATVVGLSYDVQGNLQNKNGQNYTFDYGNRLREVTGKEAYRYDGHGRRVLAWSPSGNIQSIYSQSGQILYQQSGRTSSVSENIYLGGSLLAVRERPYSSSVPVTKYQHTDALGSPIATTDSAKAFIEKTEYEPYGQVVNGPLKDGPGYTGHVLDAATGMNYMQQRYYDPMIGRFLSVDPVTAYSMPGANFNQYWYANNSPYKFKDPDGRQACNDFKCEMQRQSMSCKRDINCANALSDKGRGAEARKPTFVDKLKRNARRLGDSLKLEGSVGLKLGVKAKIGPVKAALEAGSMSPFGVGATLVDGYTFTEVRHPSAALEIGDYAAGYVGKSERSLMGRNGLAYSEEVTGGGWALGRKSWETNVSNGEVGVNAAAVFLEVGATIDVGKATIALFYWGDSAEEP